MNTSIRYIPYTEWKFLSHRWFSLHRIPYFKEICLKNAWPWGLAHILILSDKIIFEPKREEIGEWRRLQNKELHSLYRSTTTVRVIKSRRLAGHVAWMEEGRSAFNILTGTLTGNMPLGKPRRSWDDNIRINIK